MLIFWIVDDNLALLQSLKLAFQGEYEVRIFSESEACLRAFQSRNGKPDIILTDYEMQGLNGLELLEAILPGNSKIKAYLFSGVLTGKIIEEGRKTGVRGFATKPFDLVKLQKMIAG